MLNDLRARPVTGGGTNSDGKRREFIGDDDTIQLIQKPLSDKQWCDRFLSLKNRLEIEFSEMPRDIKVIKAFATLRGLCLGPEVMVSLNVSPLLHYLVG